MGEGLIEKVLHKPNKTNIARVKALNVHGEDLVKVRGFVVKENYPEPLDLEPLLKDQPGATFICHCDDVTLDDVLKVVGVVPLSRLTR